MQNQGVEVFRGRPNTFHACRIFLGSSLRFANIDAEDLLIVLHIYTRLAKTNLLSFEALKNIEAEMLS